MGCSKPQFVTCPMANRTAPQLNCWGCQFHTIESTGTDAVYYPSVAKHITEFTSDELLAEIKRRAGT